MCLLNEKPFLKYESYAILTIHGYGIKLEDQCKIITGSCCYDVLCNYLHFIVYEYYDELAFDDVEVRAFDMQQDEIKLEHFAQDIRGNEWSVSKTFSIDLDLMKKMFINLKKIDEMMLKWIDGQMDKLKNETQD